MPDSRSSSHQRDLRWESWWILSRVLNPEVFRARRMASDSHIVHVPLHGNSDSRRGHHSNVFPTSVCEKGYLVPLASRYSDCWALGPLDWCYCCISGYSRYALDRTSSQRGISHCRACRIAASECALSSSQGGRYQSRIK